ncbi:hypothetical protein FKP32DRAFT_1594402 [Trametes sanguinea]|nr:hypothetical protein FKP32DRAFT_1594402 [Trametes sanguinea]
MLEDDAERVDWGHDEDEQQAPPASDVAYAQRQTMGGYAGEDAEDAVSLGGDDEDEREFYAQHSVEQVSVVGTNILLSKATTISQTHSTSNRRDSQRQSATSSQRARTPSQPQNPESPDGNLRRTHSASTLAPTPMTHALPPKPAVVPPPYRPPSPVRPGILASAMSYRQKKTNGSGKSSVAPDGGDPLPPDWEIRYPRNGSKDAYYFNVKTEESTWVRPRLPPSGKSSPVKDRESTSGQLSPDLEAAWSDRAGRGQGPRTQRRDPTSRVATPPPPADGSLTYQDRHYRPGDVTGAVAKTEIADRRDERPGTKPTYVSESSHGRTRTPSPQAGDRRWRPRSVSPSRQRLPRRDFTPPPRGDMREASRDFDRQADVGWDRSQRQESVAGIRAAPRSPSGRRVRRKDDIEPPLRRSNDVIEPPRRPDDIDLPIYRRDDVEPRPRRKDDIEARLPRKHDFEPRRNDDIEHPLRPLPRKQPSARHENNEWPASSTLFASSSTSRLQHRRSSRGGGQVFVDCLVKPRGSSNIFPLLTVSPNACRSYEAPARGSLSLPFSLSLPVSCCIPHQSLLLRTLFLFSCRTTTSRALAPKAHRALDLPLVRGPPSACVK